MKIHLPFLYFSSFPGATVRQFLVFLTKKEASGEIFFTATLYSFGLEMSKCEFL